MSNEKCIIRFKQFFSDSLQTHSNSCFCKNDNWASIVYGFKRVFLLSRHQVLLNYLRHVYSDSTMMITNWIALWWSWENLATRQRFNNWFGPNLENIVFFLRDRIIYSRGLGFLQALKNRYKNAWIRKEHKISFGFHFGFLKKMIWSNKVQRKSNTVDNMHLLHQKINLWVPHRELQKTSVSKFAYRDNFF